MNNRETPRYELLEIAELHDNTHFLLFKVHILDISKGGMSLVSQLPIEISTRLIVKIKHKLKKKEYRLEGVILRGQPVNENYHYAMKFENDATKVIKDFFK